MCAITESHEWEEWPFVVYGGICALFSTEPALYFGASVIILSVSPHDHYSLLLNAFIIVSSSRSSRFGTNLA